MHIREKELEWLSVAQQLKLSHQCPGVVLAGEPNHATELGEAVQH